MKVDIYAVRGDDRTYPPVVDLIDARGDCWLWLGTVNDAGYGVLQMKVDGKKRVLRVHRIMWESLVGQIPVGLEIDHLCRNRLCVNPDHLEPVTHQVNNQRSGAMGRPSNGDSCQRGHPYAGHNLKMTAKGRTCRECFNIARRIRRANGSGE